MAAVAGSQPMQTCVLVWLKRDLRLHDHAPLQAALATRLPVLALYTFEPALMAASDWSARHTAFIRQSLADMQAQLTPYGIQLLVCQQDMPQALDMLRQHVHIHSIYSHQEIGNVLSFARDKAVAAWCRAHGVVWHDLPYSTIRRPLHSRNDWTKHFAAIMTQPQAAVDLAAWQPVRLSPTAQTQLAVPTDLATPAQAGVQPGGSVAGYKYLHSFLEGRVALYAKQISKPMGSRRHCSRLSPYLAWGCLSMRQVWQAQQAAAQAHPQWTFPYRFFASRLYWREHFIQKFETGWQMEHHNRNAAYNTVRTERRDDWIEAWETGHTGYPLVDACMRCLAATGYVNFRMRAMLVSFLTHHLWQDWRHGAHHLARLFLDYEPGIHYPQLQMQAGTVGTHTVRTYNPVKQGQDHDPDGSFVRQWVPELADVPTANIHQPWTLTPLEQALYGIRIGTHYPAPLVDNETAARRAQKALWDIKNDPATKRATRKLRAEKLM